MRKESKRCDPDDPVDRGLGDRWDHVAFDAEHRLVLGVVPGPRNAENIRRLVRDTRRRMAGRLPSLITTDQYAPYQQAILDAYGQTIRPPRTGKPGRPAAPYKVPPPDLRYATAHKTREKGRVVKIDFNVVFGGQAQVPEALARSKVSRQINTAFIERHNGTDRHRNARKARKTYRFSKDTDVHDAMTYFTMYSYNFCWPVRTSRIRDEHGRWRPRSPAMAAGLTDHLWPLSQWTRMPAIQLE